MNRLRRFILPIFAAAALLLTNTPVDAFHYYDPGPTGLIGMGQPTIYQQFELEKGERFLDVTMTVDGEDVEAHTDDDTGMLWYTPSSPLSPGQHNVYLRVKVRHPRASKGYYYYPVESELSFTVDEETHEVPEPDQQAMAVLDYVNQIRRAAGAAPVAYNRSLGAAAYWHARYMAENNSYAHEQQAGKPLFIGEHPWDRATYFGYIRRFGMAEDIHQISDPLPAVDDWLSGPYHRFPIIAPESAEIGFGTADRYAVLDFGMGEARDQVVVWPYAGQADVPIAWDGLENPTPLRLYPGVEAPVGSVVSLQFGRQVESLRLEEASLTAADGPPVSFMTFTPQNDDHLSDGLFLIPYEPYAPGTTYEVAVAGEVTFQDGEKERFQERWRFTTAGEKPAVKEPEPADPPEETPPGEPVTPDPPGETAPPAEPAPPDPTPDLAAPVNLSDIQGHWAAEQIAQLVRAGVVGGYPDGTFRPDAPLTRSAFVKMLETALGLPLQPGVSSFTDTAGHWSAQGGYLGSALQAGIIQQADYPGGRFEPERSITRDEIAVMLARAAGLPLPDVRPGQYTEAQISGRLFRDVSTWAHPAHVEAAVEAGLVTGYAENDGTFTFRPNDPATRAEAVVMVLRLMNLVNG